MKLVVLDCETYYDREYSLSKITTEDYVRSPQFELIGFAIKTNDGPTQWVPKPECEAFLKSFDWSDAMVVCQNTAFDGAILDWLYGVKPMVWADTLGMSRALYPHDKAHSLKAQAERMGVGVKGDEVLNAIGKRYADFYDAELARYASYCINDVELTYDIFMKYMDMGFPKQELKLIDLTLRMFIEPVLELDPVKLSEHLEGVKESKLALLETVRDHMLKDADPDYVHAIYTEGMEGIKKLLMSNDKFALALQSLGVDPPTKVSPATKKTAWAFAKTDDAFKALEEHEDERVQALVAARLGNKTTLEETRTERFIGMARRGKFPVPLRYYGAHSGRWSGQDSVNLQNLPSRGANAGKIKKAILAPEGYVVIDCDSAQIEARVLAWLAGQDELVQAFKDKQDVYRLMAAKIYGIPTEDVTSGAGSQRQVGKTAVLGCFGPDTVVLTQRGWVPIIQVLGTDTVWDGDEWVQHHGVVPQGEKEVLTTLGLSATADHEILTERGWVEWHAVLANLSHLGSALSLASLPASIGNCARMDPSGKASTVISPRCDVRAGGKGSWIAQTSVRAALRAAIVALKRKLNALAPQRWGLRQFAQTQRTGSGYSQGSAQSSAAAPTPTTRSTLIMEVVESRFIPRGLKSAWTSCDTLSGLTGGTSPSWSSTASTTVVGTFRAIFGLSVKAQTIPTEGAQPPEKLKPCVVSCDSLKQRMQTYDIAYAGPRNRYTVLTSEGPIIVHNCGYGVGHVKLQAFLKTQAGVVVSLDEAKRIIDTYRSSAYKIADFWRSAGDALSSLLTGQTMQVDAVGLIRAIPGKGLTLPSGLHIQYPGLRKIPNEEGKTELVYTSKGLPVRIYGGKVVENICQAVARQVVAEQMLRVSKRYKVVLTVHDAVAIVAKKEEAAEAQAYLEECMSWNPKWATGLPLACESGMGASYGDC
jgi:DNA polymerase I-like protein with 3'-5' exonuclease and polymerase domains